MKFISTEFEGVYVIENFNMEDHRGQFVKIYHKDQYEKHGLCTDYLENYFTISKKDVIRGMHFQLPPHDHNKLVHVVKGCVTDVILDIRKSSKTFGKFFEIELDAQKHLSLYIPKGFAHGYKSHCDDTIVAYNVSTVHFSEHDAGISYDSFGYDWKVLNPILSDRDKRLISFQDFQEMNPF